MESQQHEKGTPVVPPIVHAATYRFESSADLIDVVNHRTGYVYSRWDNPTVREAERRLAAIEAYEEAVAFGSGMAAITTSILAYARPGDRVVAIATYGETVRFFVDFLPSIGISTTVLGANDTDVCHEALRTGAAILYLESPMNPLLRVLDMAALVKSAHERGAIAVLDATFASPINLRPLSFGVDITIHSATKYLGGHHDVTAGFACADTETAHRLWMLRRMLGGILDPTQAYLVWRGLQTLEVRVKRQNESAERIAAWLIDQPGICAVHYPGLESHPDHAVAARQMLGYGGIVSFELDADHAATSRFMDRLRTIKLATSLGGVTSLANQSVTNTHASMREEERAKAGISDSLIRFSVGLEPVEALIADLNQALASLG